MTEQVAYGYDRKFRLRGGVLLQPQKDGSILFSHCKVHENDMVKGKNSRSSIRRVLEARMERGKAIRIDGDNMNAARDYALNEIGLLPHREAYPHVQREAWEELATRMRTYYKGDKKAIDRAMDIVRNKVLYGQVQAT